MNRCSSGFESVWVNVKNWRL